MHSLSSLLLHWAVLVEQALLRLLLVAIGLAFVAAAVPFTVSILLLPIALFLALIAVGVLVWAVAGDVSIGAEAGQLTTTARVLHTPWDCRRSQHAYGRSGADKQQPESTWLRFRWSSRPRPVTEKDCAQCMAWEPNQYRPEQERAA